MEFRTLRADEIECRVQLYNRDKGVSLLLYKDARADMILLDETVGAENWQRSHELINGNLYCNVGIYIKRAEDGGYNEWVWKQDVGTESNTEAEKGQASDSFKRACVNWGIGRELYTAPFIWIPAEKIEWAENGKPKSTFRVTKVDYDLNRRITQLVISTKKGVVYEYNNDIETAETPEKKPKKTTVAKNATTEAVICPVCGKEVKGMTGKKGREYSPAEVLQLCGMCHDCYTLKQITEGKK